MSSGNCHWGKWRCRYLKDNHQNIAEFEAHSIAAKKFYSFISGVRRSSKRAGSRRSTSRTSKRRYPSTSLSSGKTSAASARTSCLRTTRSMPLNQKGNSLTEFSRMEDPTLGRLTTVRSHSSRRRPCRRKTKLGTKNYKTFFVLKQGNVNYS